MSRVYRCKDRKGCWIDYLDSNGVRVRENVCATHRVGLDNFHLHDLRHSFGAHAANGTRQRGVQALLRHKDTRMTARYSHLTDKYLRVALDSVNLGGGGRCSRTAGKPPERTGTQGR